MRQLGLIQFDKRGLDAAIMGTGKAIGSGFLVVLCAAVLSSCRSTTAPPPPSDLKVSFGRVERLANFESQYVTARHVDVWLPDGYSPENRYSVLYMHDGQMLFDTSITWNQQEWGVDEVLGRLLQEDKIEDCIVVGAWNAGIERHPDYFPEKPFHTLDKGYLDTLLALARDAGQTELDSVYVQSDNYLKFLVKELKPHIDQTYATRTGKDHTYVAGSSMGGLISMYALLEYPDVFGGAACISTHWPGSYDFKNNYIFDAFITYMDRNLPPPGVCKIYFDYGTETLDAEYERYQVQVDALMMQKGYTAASWMTRKFEGENHSEASWTKRLDVPVQFLLGKE